MKQHFIDEKTGISYTLQGDYYLPDLALPAEKETKPISVWGQRYKRYLKEHKIAAYTTLLTSGTLNRYLSDIGEQSEEMFSRLVKQIAECESVRA